MSKGKKNILWFEEVDKTHIGQVGGKGANLGEMLKAGFPVPYGFVVTADAYFYFLEHNNLKHRLTNILDGLDVENSKQLVIAGATARRLIRDSRVPPDLLVAIATAYEHLLSRQEKIIKKTNYGKQMIAHLAGAIANPLVAVRSSATAEDLPTASFAGQQETYLNVQGESELIAKVRECWASLFTDRAIYYRVAQGFEHNKVGLAAVVQLMIQSQQSGVAFSIDPVTNEKSKIVIEAIYGLGELIVQGSVTPDHYEVEKSTLKIVKKSIKRQERALTKKGKKNIERKLGRQGGEQKISDEEIKTIAGLVKRIERHYFFPQDIEWAVADGFTYIVQSRPITTVAGSKKGLDGESADLAKTTTGPASALMISADPASPGIAVGKPRVLSSPRENDKLKAGDVLVAAYTSPDYVPAMKRASAIVTEMGGRTSHAAIVSRELGIPAVVGASGATKLLAKYDLITVNGSRGEVYKGAVFTPDQLAKIARKKSAASNVKTVTKIYVNLAQPESADRVAKLHVDGIGLLRAEFIIAHIGEHPKAIIKKGQQKRFINTLSEKLLMFAKPFAPRPIVYRATDFRTNEYRHLKGGEEYEPHEENPMIGYRGATRYISDTAVFEMELAAIKKVREAGYRNINLMIPFVRVPGEMVAIRKILKKNNLLDQPSFKLWIMVEVPSAAIAVEEFIKTGVDGISIGTNDLTMLLLGVDRDNQEIAHLYDERNPVVLWALERIITTARKYGVSVSICGQAPSDYPELTEKLVQWGITSISVTPDVVDRTRILVHDIEVKLWQKSRKSRREKS